MMRPGQRPDGVFRNDNRLMADIDPTFMEQILDLSQRKRKTDIHHHRQADDLGRHLEISEWVFHPPKLRNVLCRLKSVCSDTACHSLKAELFVHFSEEWLAALKSPDVVDESFVVAPAPELACPGRMGSHHHIGIAP